MKFSKYLLIIGGILICWEIFWFVRFKLTINVAQTIARAFLFFGFILFLIFILIIIAISLIKKKKKKR